MSIVTDFFPRLHERKQTVSEVGRPAQSAGVAVPTPCVVPTPGRSTFIISAPDREYLSGPWSSNDPAKIQHAKPSEAPSHFIRPQLNA